MGELQKGASSLGKVAESARVRTEPPLRYLEVRSSDKTYELPIRARARVVPETADTSSPEYRDSGLECWLDGVCA